MLHGVEEFGTSAKPYGGRSKVRTRECVEPVFLSISEQMA